MILDFSLIIFSCCFFDRLTVLCIC